MGITTNPWEDTMTKINTLLLTTLLASSVATFSAQASDTEGWGYADTDAWVVDFNSNTQMVVRDSRVDEIVADPAKVKVYETNDVREVLLTYNPSKKKTGVDKLGRPYNQVVKIEFGAAEPKERTRKDGTKVTYMLDISKPLVAEYTGLVTMNDQDLKDALTNEAGKSRAARVADVLKLEMQTEILNARALQQDVAKKEMETQLAAILASQEAITQAYKTRKAIIATDAEYTDALIKADAVNRANLEALKVELAAQAATFDYGTPLPTVAGAPTKEEVAKPITYTPINRDELNREALNYRFEECDVISNTDLAGIEAKKAALLKQGVETNKALTAKIDAAIAALDYNFKAAVWDKYKAVIAEARNPKPVVETVAEVAVEAPADTALAPAEENK